MTGELVNECIPDWLLHLDEEELPPELRSKVYPTEDKEQLKARAQHFWREFYARNKDRHDAYGEKIATFSFKAEGLPDDCGAAYQAVFHREALGGFENLARTRRFFRQLTMGPEGKVKLNGTHFYLASLLALQPRGSSISEPSDRYKARRPFVRTILTTNFDPLLQVSLQLVNLLYYTSDQPDLLQLDLTSEAIHNEIQIVHVHGSIHRPFLANSRTDLDAMRNRHADGLAGFLGGHGVIVLGSGGWEDCLTEALKRCQHLPHGLYWLGRDEASLPQPVVDLLKQHTGDAFFVRITDASDFVARLYSALAPRLNLPELLVEPLLLLRREMEKIDLSSAAPLPKAAKITPAQVLLTNLDLLQQAHDRFFAPKSDLDVQEQAATATRGLTPDAAAQLLRQADLRYSDKKFPMALGLYDALIENKALHGRNLASALFRRGDCHGEAGETDKAIADYSAVIQMPDAPPETRGPALGMRGLSDNAPDPRRSAKKWIAPLEPLIDMRSAFNLLASPAEPGATASSDAHR